MCPIPPNYQNLDLSRPSEESDFRIQCRGRSWYVHKSVVCVDSNYFKVISKGIFGDGDQNGCVLEEEEPRIIELILHFMYNKDYKEHAVYTDIRHISETEYASTVEKAYNLYNKDDNRDPHTTALKEKLICGMGTLQTHIEVYIAADRLLIAGLPQVAAAKALDILQIAEFFTSPRLVKPLRFMLNKTRSNDRFLRTPCLTFLLSKQDLIATFNKPLDALLQEKELPAYTIAKRANYYEAVESMNTRLNGMFKRHDDINIEETRRFFSKDQWCPIRRCRKRLSSPNNLRHCNYKLRVSYGEDLGESTILGRQRTFLEAHCHLPGCIGMRYVGLDPYTEPELKEWEELAAEAESLEKTKPEISTGAALVEENWIIPLTGGRRDIKGGMEEKLFRLQEIVHFCL